MKTSRIVFILLFPLIAEVVVSCCECTEPFIGNYTNQTILVNNLDNSGSEPMLATTNSVPKAAFGIRINLSREKTACSNPPRSFFIQSAYARKCDCPPPHQLLAKDSVSAIQIFTLNDFDSNHPANSEVSEYFKIFKGTSFITIEEYVAKRRTTLYSDSELEESFDALLMTTPSFNESHQFKILISLSDGRTLEGITSSIDLI